MGKFLTAFIAVVLLTNCAPEARDVSQRGGRTPDQLEDGWQVAPPAQFNADTALIDSMIERTKRETYANIHSILVVKDGLLVIEQYFDGHVRGDLHQIRSATKSIGSILVGIAVDKGFVASENQPIYTFFEADYEPADGWSSRAKTVEIRHLLSMMSGYDCEDLTTNFACENAMYGTDDWVQYALDLPFAHAPGERWAYNSSSLILAGEAVARGSGLDVDAFAERFLFKPLGIERFRWQFSPKGRAWIGGGARMIPREMAKIGQLMLDRGVWNGERIMSEEWIDKSTRRQGDMLGGVDYCYLWQRGEWYCGRDLMTAFWASGNGGQYIIVIPEAGMVVVFTGGNYDSPLAGQPFQMLTRYILPAFLRPSPLEIVTLDRKETEKLTGTYFLDFEPSASSTIGIDNGRLYLLAPDNETIELVAHSPIFFTGDSQHGPITVVFGVGDGEGVVNHTIYGSFQRFVFERE
ncbi:MAG: serine hydrolase [Candidatus Latescibacterota bacterium]|nr:MAG: serine hydrolase [Candidatus Latescibacterota bacterium]